MFDAQAIFWFAAGAQDSLVCPENFASIWLKARNCHDQTNFGMPTTVNSEAVADLFVMAECSDMDDVVGL